MAKVLALLGAAVIAAPTAAYSQDSLVSRALEMQRRGDALGAYALLSPQATTRAGEPGFDYALGLAAADSGHPGEAILALQRVLAKQPSNAAARAEIARVYAMTGDIDTAKAEFDTVVDDPTTPDPVRQRLNRLVRDYDRQMHGGGRQVTGFIDGEVGYDGNVNAATSATSITLPVFAFLGPASLSGAATRMDVGNYQAQGGISAATGLSRQDRAYGSLLGSWRDNFGGDAFDQGALTATAGLAHTLAGRDVASVSGQVQRFWLGRDGYRTSAGVVGQYTRRLSDSQALSGQLQYFHFDYDTDRLRDADRYTATVNYVGRNTFGSIGGGLEETVRSPARNLGFYFVAGQAGGEFPIARNLAVLAGASVEHRDYRAADPLFLKVRDDTQLDGSVGLRVALGRGLSLRPRVTYTRTFSNIGLYDYSRFTAAVGVRFEY